MPSQSFRRTNALKVISNSKEKRKGIQGKRKAGDPVSRGPNPVAQLKKKTQGNSCAQLRK